jgi:hypothetical protein
VIYSFTHSCDPQLHTNDEKCSNEYKDSTSKAKRYNMGSILQIEGIKFRNCVNEHELGKLQQKANVHCEGEEIENLFTCPPEPL